MLIKIHKNTQNRGTPDRPQYMIFLRYGSRLTQECWLDATTDQEALAEARQRFPEARELLFLEKEG